jgi:uncharacterized protein
MGKLLILLLVALVLYFLWRGFGREPGRGKGAGAQPEGERMVGCQQCGVHLPLSEAVQSQGRYFCCEEHLRLFNR